ncbi:MAG: M1 family metallopeptidase [Microscillaceae bacterium]|nr:M1 family metallopeptidase [Microscillaceae bacterium]
MAQIPPDSLPLRPTPTRFFDLLHTRLALEPDFARQALSGLADLSLVPYFYPQSVLQLAAKRMEIQQVELLRGAEKVPLSFQHEGQKLHIVLDKSYTRQDTLRLSIAYIARPEADWPQAHLPSHEKGLFFINPEGKIPDIPTQLWTQGQSESASCWFPTLDVPNERATQEIYLTVEKNLLLSLMGSWSISAKTPMAPAPITGSWTSPMPLTWPPLW